MHCNIKRLEPIYMYFLKHYLINPPTFCIYRKDWYIVNIYKIGIR